MTHTEDHPRIPTTPRGAADGSVIRPLEALGRTGITDLGDHLTTAEGPVEVPEEGDEAT